LGSKVTPKLSKHLGDKPAGKTSQKINHQTTIARKGQPNHLTSVFNPFPQRGGGGVFAKAGPKG